MQVLSLFEWADVAAVCLICLCMLCRRLYSKVKRQRTVTHDTASIIAEFKPPITTTQTVKLLSYLVDINPAKLTKRDKELLNTMLLDVAITLSNSR